MRDLTNRVRLMRQASAVERCHSKTHLMRYSNGHHTHDMMSLIIQCWMADHTGWLPSPALLVRAHVHDAGEVVTGDVPSPIKDLLGEKLHAVDARIEQWLDCDQPLTGEEREYLEAADRFELWMWCREEVMRGNTEVADWLESCQVKLESMKLPPAFQKLMEAVSDPYYVAHLSVKQLHAAGGLA